MLLDKKHTPLTAPQVDKSDTILERYCAFFGNYELTSIDMFKFLTKPSAKRDEFIAEHCNVSYNATNELFVDFKIS